MAYSVDLDTLILRVRERTNKESSDFVTDAELTRYINAALAALHELIVDSNEDYFLAQSGVVATVGDHEVDLPDDFWKLRLLMRGTNGSTTGFVELVKSDVSTTVPLIGVSGTPEYYTLTNVLNVFPAPSSTSIAFVIVYIPCATVLATGSDTYDCVNGWDEFVVTHAAIAVRDKEEVDCSVLMGALGMLKQRIQQAVKPRDQGQARTIRRVRDDYGRDTWRRRWEVP